MLSDNIEKLLEEISREVLDNWIHGSYAEFAGDIGRYLGSQELKNLVATRKNTKSVWYEGLDVTVEDYRTFYGHSGDEGYPAERVFTFSSKVFTFSRNDRVINISEGNKLVLSAGRNLRGDDKFTNWRITDTRKEINLGDYLQRVLETLKKVPIVGFY